MIAHERIALRCAACLWGVATLGRVRATIVFHTDIFVIYFKTVISPEAF